MLVFAENKRRVLAGVGTVVALLLIGFAIGRLSGGGSTASAQTAPPTPRTSPMAALSPAS
jgi:hypothetical protein